nr:restriction endonuclease subunit S [Pseudoalteromonas sp. CnMc7-37]
MFPDKDRLDRKYLTYYLRSNSFVNWISDQVAGAKMPRVSMKVFWEHQIPLPPLEEQKRIAAILDKADSVRCKRQQAIDLADDFLRSVFLDMFGDPVTNPKGWETKPLKLLCDIKGGGTPSKSNETYWGGDIPWVSPKDMKSLYISTSKDKITSEAIKGSSTKLIDTDSVLMVVRSGVLKHTVPLALTTKPVSINQDMKAFSCRADLNSHYLLFCLKAFSQFLLGTVRGTTADNLSSDVINNLSVPVPPIEMQEKFASIALKQQSTKAKNKNSNDLSLLSFNSLSQKAFVGEL